MIVRLRKTKISLFKKKKKKMYLWEILWEVAESRLCNWNGFMSYKSNSEMTRLFSETMHGTCKINWPACGGEQGQVGADKAWHKSLGTQHASERSSFHLFNERESTEEKLGWEALKNRDGVPEGGPIRQGQVSAFRPEAIKVFQPFIRKCTVH